MSGAEAIGLAASIVQLVDLGARLAVLVMNVYKGMQEAPGRAQKQVEELRLLINTANFIREHRSLFDSPFVHASVSAALFEARRLELILDRLTADHTKGFVAIRYWRIAVGSKEPQIHFQFERLKHAKTQLIFSLTIDQTSKLVSLQDSVDQVQTLLALDREEKRSVSAFRALGSNHWTKAEDGSDTKSIFWTWKQQSKWSSSQDEQKGEVQSGTLR